MKKRMGNAFLAALLAVGVCSCASTSKSSKAAMAPQDLTPPPATIPGPVNNPPDDPCWLVDLRCMPEKPGLRYVRGISEVLPSEKRADQDALEGAVDIIVIALGGYLKQTLIEAGSRDIEAETLVGDAVVQNGIKEKTREHILNESWPTTRVVRSWREYTGDRWTSVKWKVYALVEYNEEDASKLLSESLPERTVNQEILDRARSILEKKSREHGLVE